MAELKTKKTRASVDAFLKKAATGKRLEDCYTVLDIMKKIMKEEPKMWGSAIVGFGKYHYKYKSGHKGEMCIAAFSPRKTSLTLYILPSLLKNAELMKKLGKHKKGLSCLHIKDLEDIDLKVLKELIKLSVKNVKSFEQFSQRAHEM